VPHAGLQMALACVAGCALCVVMLRQFRHSAFLAPPQAALPATTPRRERFRSQEERQLARLKMLSARG
ncbi:MAG TPA: hypothetical protein VKU82_12495, partial [Planctomycetaceae bacterium]|nr:hypothetical protein [Planctomycetaceae bacterium]